jgi:hypothetical protein
VEEFIARENIRRFKEQLAACDEPGQRKTLQRSLDAERKRLKEAKIIKAVSPATMPPKKVR